MTKADGLPSLILRSLEWVLTIAFSALATPDCERRNRGKGSMLALYGVRKRD
jgi:hypothetical protein